MKAMICFLLLFFSINSFSNEYNIGEVISLKNLYTKLNKSVFSSLTGKSDQSLKKKIDSLPLNKKKEAHNIINELSDIIPADFLRYYITYKLVENNEEKLRDTLYLNMLYKSFIIRDAIQSPLSSNEHIKKSYSLAKKIYHRKDLKEGSFYQKLKSNLEEKSKIIAKIEDTNQFITAIKETESLATKLGPEYKPYSLSFIEYIPGNDLALLGQSSIDDNDKILFFNKPLFKKYKQLITQAKSSILFSSPYIGGDLGDAFIDLLIEKTKKELVSNKDFKTIVLTPFTFKKKYYLEVESTLKILTEKIKKNKLDNALHLVNSDIIASPISTLRNNTRLLLIDPNSDYPQAYIGSKSLTTSNGAHSFDNMMWIKGPAAAVINDFVTSEIKLPDNELLSIISTTRSKYPFAGIQKVRIVENDTKSFKNIKNFIIDMIISANKSIYMEQRYLFDPEVNDAIIKAKIKNPKLNVKIIIDSNEDLGLNGLPNSIYIQELKVYGINLRARKVKSKLNINNRRILSVDGKSLLLSSSNINYQGLQGKQRDLGVQIFDKDEILKFDKAFKSDWSNKSKTVNLDIENFEATIEGETLSKEFSSVINAISKAFIKFKESFK